ncbi:hypothetical protein GCM10008174_33870 [Methylopila turkensis]|uniref:Uncharacterized protein n=1 Tax=Methylopila turkensis TaxID=1437816 RepID=A0A9W6JPZ4_9HYPH|nr:hypothetical protein GCM10008174_33870 [Methylopila turkensis]
MLRRGGLIWFTGSGTLERRRQPASGRLSVWRDRFEIPSPDPIRERAARRDGRDARRRFDDTARVEPPHPRARPGCGGLRAQGA